MIVRWRFRINTPEYHGKITGCDTGNGVEYWYDCYRWSFSRILTQMIKTIFDSYIGPCLSPIKYGTTHDNYLKFQADFFYRKKFIFQNPIGNIFSRFGTWRFLEYIWLRIRDQIHRFKMAGLNATELPNFY